MTLNASRKGKRHERDVQRLYRALAGWDASRASAMLEAAGGLTGVDVRAWSPDLRLAIQVRSRARVNVFEALADAVAGALASELPLAHIKRTHPDELRAERVVCLREDDWLDLVARFASGSVGAELTSPSGVRAPSQRRPDSFSLHGG